MDDFQFTLHELSGELSSKTLEVAMRKGVTVYDASYVALAELLGTVAYTADERLLRKVGDRAKHVRDFSLE